MRACVRGWRRRRPNDSKRPTFRSFKPSLLNAPNANLALCKGRSTGTEFPERHAPLNGTGVGGGASSGTLLPFPGAKFCPEPKPWVKRDLPPLNNQPKWFVYLERGWAGPAPAPAPPKSLSIGVPRLAVALERVTDDEATH